jgi:hypothetical protein
MSKAQMIARAWLDDGFRASLAAQGIDVPPRPDDLGDDQLDVLAGVREHEAPAPACTCCCC